MKIIFSSYKSRCRIVILLIFGFLCFQSQAQVVKVIDNKGTITEVNNNQVITAATAPTTPLEGDVWFDTATNITKIWDGTVWKEIDSDQVTTAATAPTTPLEGDVWFDTTTNISKIWDGTVWKEIDSDQVTTAATAPTTPVVGDVWFDTTTNISKIWDGTIWKEIASDFISSTTHISSATPLTDAHSTTKVHIEPSGSTSLDGATLSNGFSTLIINHSGAKSTINFSNFAGVFELNTSKSNITSNGNFDLEYLESAILTITEGGGNKYLNISKFGGADVSSVPLWKSNTNGGTYTKNDIVNYEGELYKSFTGTNTDTAPSSDFVNWLPTIIDANGKIIGAELDIKAGGTSLATGGTITTDGNYTVHTFTSSGTFTPNGNLNVEYLVVGGGGAGGIATSAGGGGGGGFRTGLLTITNSAKTVTVGAGGTGANGVRGADGGNSVFDTITANGGGGGGNNDNPGGSGGSGGGAGSKSTAPGTGTAGQGNDGGDGVNSGPSFGAGGGGGAAGAGVDATLALAGAGGAGLSSNISGATVFYAGGGGGAAFGTGLGGAGGTGGGGSGAEGPGATINDGVAGTPNTGGGGGGGSSTATHASGGSGVVIIRYLTVKTTAIISDTNGNVGIGIGTPTDKLHVNGDIRITGLLKDENNESGTAGQILSSTATGTDWIDAPGGGINNWVLTNAYALGDVVIKDNKIYQANAVIPASTVFAEGTTGATWKEISSASITDWINNTNGGTYAINDLISYNGVIYKNITGTNLDTLPNADAANWEVAIKAYLGSTTHIATAIPLTDAHSTTKVHIEPSGSISLDGATLSDGFSTLVINHSGATSFISFSNFLGVFQLNTSKSNITANGNFSLEYLESAILTITEGGGNKYLNISRFGGVDTVPIWKSNTNGGLYASNNIVSHNGVLYKNLTGANTNTTPNIDNTNWTPTIIDENGKVIGKSLEISPGSGTPATGGTITTSGAYTVHTFTSGGTFTPNGNLDVEYLVVGGGGSGGGTGGGGGGAGGFITGTLRLTDTPKTVTIGAGGVASTGGGNNGANSVFDSITANGGGGGGAYQSAGQNGASGGGVGRDGGANGGNGTVGQGNDGGDTTVGWSGGGGGGGAGSVGGNGGGGTSSTDFGGNGGAGLLSNINGTPTFYAGGGGGGSAGTNNAPGAGGNGGGGAGGHDANGVSATANTGGGGGAGGGGSTTSGAGGSGIVIVRYLTGGITLAATGVNVGVGTASPTDKLHVEGDTRITGALKDSNNEAGTLGQVLSSTATGTDWIDAPTGVQAYDNAAARDAAIPSPTEGLVVYMKDSDNIYTYNGTAWVNDSDGASHEFRATQVSASLQIPSNSYIAVPFTTEEYDVSNAYNTTTGVYTVPESGVYVFSWATRHYNSDKIKARINDLRVNGTTVAHGTQVTTSSTTNEGVLTGSAVIKLNVGDTVQIFTYQQSTDASTETIIYATVPSSWNFSGTRISGGTSGSAEASIKVWLSNTNGGVYTTNNLASHNEVIYKNLTGTNTDTAPNSDSTNWAPIVIDENEKIIGKALDISIPVSTTLATGGTITTSGEWTIHTFTSGGTFTPNGNTEVEYLIIGGGGGGGSNLGGGGGAGEYIAGSTIITNTAKTVTIGAGGIAGVGSTQPLEQGGDGGETTFGTITAKGGGGGGAIATNGRQGGSGGGGGTVGGLGGTTSTSGGGLVNNGAEGSVAGSFQATGGGGGGSASTPAQAVDGDAPGGEGTTSSITGTPVARAGGGGGGWNTTGTPTDLNGRAGGGNGGAQNQNGTDATANTGSGGGGGGNNDSHGVNAGAGGSGIVIIRYRAGGSVLTTTTDGKVGIGTSSPSATLSVNGVANKSGGATWSVFSDARSKENVKNYKRGLSEIMKLRPVSFNYKKDFEWGSDTHIGLIAQEVEKIVPSMISTKKIGDIKDFKEVDPNELTYMLIKSIQEQQNMIDKLKSENLVLKADNKALKSETAKISKLTAEINAIKLALIKKSHE